MTFVPLPACHTPTYACIGVRCHRKPPNHQNIGRRQMFDRLDVLAIRKDIFLTPKLVRKDNFFCVYVSLTQILKCGETQII